MNAEKIIEYAVKDYSEYNANGRKGVSRMHTESIEERRRDANESVNVCIRCVIIWITFQEVCRRVEPCAEHPTPTVHVKEEAQHYQVEVAPLAG